MTDEIYVDVIGGVGISAGLVRIDLTSRQAVTGEPNGRAETCQRVIMPIQGFLAAMVTMTELAETLTATRPPAPRPESPVAAEARPPQSPNFR